MEDNSIMDVLISDLIASAYEEHFEHNEEISRYTLVTKKPSPFNDNVDIQITTRGILVGSDYLVIFLPNGTIFSANIPSVNYLTIEVM